MSEADGQADRQARILPLLPAHNLNSVRSHSPKDGRAPWTCALIPLHRGDPLTKMHEEMQKMGANLPPGAALAVQIPEEARKPPPSRCRSLRSRSHARTPESPERVTHTSARHMHTRG
jgi:hypothetical protein